MAGGSGHVIDPDGEARRALQAAVAEHGPAALSDTALIDAVCSDRLAGLRGEAVMIRTAAAADVPARLRQQPGGPGSDQAIESVAATLAREHSLKKAACEWVVGEFARALGYSSSGEDRAPEAVAPEVPAGDAPGVPRGGGRPPRRRVSRGVLGAVAALALIGIYLGVAAVAHLAPWHAAAALSSPSATPPRSGSPASPSQVTSTPRSPYATLLSMIPGDVRAGRCRNLGGSYEALGAVAAIGCNGVPRLGAGAFIYWLFPDPVSLSNGYRRFLVGNRFRGSHQCGGGRFVASCEAAYSGGSPRISGTLAEYRSPRTKFPVITCTATQQRVLVEMAGTNARNLLAYFNQLRWLVATEPGVPR